MMSSIDAAYPVSYKWSIRTFVVSITVWRIMPVFGYGTLGFPVTGSGNDRFPALPVKWKVRNHVESLFGWGFLYILHNTF